VVSLYNILKKNPFISNSFGPTHNAKTNSNNDSKTKADSLRRQRGRVQWPDSAHTAHLHLVQINKILT